MKLKELFETEERSILSVMGKREDFYPGIFDCANKRLTSLKGAPTTIGSSFSCYFNQLTSLEGVPHTIGGNFYCHGNKLTSLKGIHKQIKYIDGSAVFKQNPIKSHVLGLLKIKGLIDCELDQLRVQHIVNTHLKGDRDIFACQEELIEAGYPEYAQL
jgi:hypothetical protein